MGSPRRAVAALAALAAAVIVVGLLARRGPDESRGATLSRTAFVAEADRICSGLGRANRRLEPAPRPYDAQAVGFFDALHDNTVSARGQLEQIEPPAAERAALDRLVGAYRSLEVKLEQASGAASVEQDPEVSALIAEVVEGTRAVAAEERALGVCAGTRSAEQTIGREVARTRENPLTQTGPLLP